MIIGCDTGFFLQLLIGNETANLYWKKITEERLSAIVSLLSMAELSVLSQKQHIDEHTLHTLQGAIQSTCTIDSFSTQETFHNCGIWSRDFGCSLTQAMICHAFYKNGASTILTTDPSFKGFSFLSSEVILL